MNALLFITSDRFDTDFRSTGGKQIAEIPIDGLKSQVDAVISGLDDLFAARADALKNYELAEFTVSLEVTASGKIGILGTGVETSGTGGIELTFRRKSSS